MYNYALHFDSSWPSSASSLLYTCQSVSGKIFVKLNVMTSLLLGSYVLTPATIEPQRQKTYIRTCASSEDSDQAAHLHSLIRTSNGRILDNK